VSAPGFLAVGGVEVANNARTVAYMQRGLAGPWFQAVTAQACPDLTLEAYPLAVCAAASSDQFYADPRSGFRVPTTGAAPTSSSLLWDASGWIEGVGQTTTVGGGLVIPNQGSVPLRIKANVDFLVAAPAGGRSIEVARPINVGTANVAWYGLGLRWNGSNWLLCTTGRTLAANSGLGNNVTVASTLLGSYWLEVVFSATGFVGRLWSGDPDLPGSSVIGSLTYGYSSLATGTWYTDMGVTEQASFGAVTEAGIFSFTGGFPLGSEVVISELGWSVPCTQSALADLFPADTLWPADDLYPGLYGEFHDPGTDNAPWVDTDRPEGYGFLGLLIQDIKGLDTTSDRSVDAAADGIGGILGPETLAARVITVDGTLVASDCSAMEYARRWLAETLADALCDGCDLSFVDVRTTCGDDPLGDFNTNRWRLVNVGLTGMTTDTSGGEMCCFVTPVTFELTAGDPYLYGPAVPAVAATTLNPGASDSSTVPFETWYFGGGATSVCTTVVDQGQGIDAPIFTFTGGATGIEAGFAYPSVGLYPSDAIWPSDATIPGDGTLQETAGVAPFAFDFSIGPSETFVVNCATRTLQWTLADGTILDGAPKLNLAAGEVVQWIDTCAGASIDACAAAFAGCSCDDTPTVTIQTQHRER